jgi:hypothetical protein
MPCAFNAKKVEASSNHPDRQQQFDYIAAQRATFTAGQLPILSVDTDTPAFAVDAIASWWQTEGRTTYLGADHLLLLADAGRSNGYQTRAWKERLQVQICDRFVARPLTGSRTRSVRCPHRGRP